MTTDLEKEYGDALVAAHDQRINDAKRIAELEAALIEACDGWATWRQAPRIEELRALARGGR
jgi:hypothetical protein